MQANEYTIGIRISLILLAAYVAYGYFLWYCFTSRALLLGALLSIACVWTLLNFGFCIQFVRKGK